MPPHREWIVLLNRFSSSGDGGLLVLQQLGDAFLAKREQLGECGRAEGGAFGGALNFDDVAGGGHYEVDVAVAAGVFGVVQIEQGHAADDTERHGGYGFADRAMREFACGQELADGQMQGDVCAGDAGGAGTAVGLDYVAIDQDLAFAQPAQIYGGTQGAADQALDFLGAAGLLALGGFTAHTAGGGGGEHAIFGGYPALIFAAQKGRNGFVDAGGANHFGVAAGNQDRAVGMGQEVGRDADGAQLVGSTAGADGGWGHGVLAM